MIKKLKYFSFLETKRRHPNVKESAEETIVKELIETKKHNFVDFCNELKINLFRYLGI